MRSLSALALSLLALFTAPACGASGSDGGAEVDGGETPDGGGIADAGAGTSNLGVSCDPTVMQSDCPPDVPLCLAVSAAATEGFCSKPCALTPQPDGGMPVPPMDSHAICGQGYSASSATPACSFFLEPEMGMIPWACGLACGQTATRNFGDCPANLTCTQEDPERNGFCFP
jgi:hypothetical protein